MTHLLERIKEIDEDAARELERAGFTTDQEIRSLDRQDLLELLPGKDNLRVRKEIHTFIHNTARWSFPSLFSFFLSKPHNQAVQFPDSATGSQSRTNINPLRKSQTATVRYKTVVSGKTLDTHLEVIQKLNGPFPEHNVCLQLLEVRDESYQVILLFCPVVSRMGTDLDAALRQISSDKPLIVVAMHHMHTARSVPAPKTRATHDLGVNVFFHETVNGLLSCSQNEDAITEMKTKLLHYITKRSCTN